MDPTQEQVETRKLMASVREALDRIIAEFRPKQSPSPDADERQDKPSLSPNSK